MGVAALKSIVKGRFDPFSLNILQASLVMIDKGGLQYETDAY
jgi:hypothetical protein